MISIKWNSFHKCDVSNEYSITITRVPSVAYSKGTVNGNAKLMNVYTH